VSKRRSVFRVVAVVVLLQHAATAQTAPLPVDVVHTANPQINDWRFVVAPYGWMTGISGETGVRDLSADIDMSFSDLLSHLKFAAMGTFEASRGAGLGIVDAMYSSIRIDHTLSRGRIQPELDFTTKMLITQAFAAYTVKPSPRIDVDLMAGARLWAVKSTLGLSTDRGQRQREKSPSWIDGLLGARLRWRASRKLQFNLEGDGGAGGSKAAGEGIAVASYDFSRHWAAYGSFRYLYENYQKGDYFFTGHLSGPLIGAAYHW
jgi:hypothetical protein